MQTVTLPIHTTCGVFMARYSDQGLAQLEFPSKKSVKCATEVPAQLQRWHALTVKALESALANKPVKQMPPLDTRSGTEFRRRVWAALQQIEPGSTVSYGELGASIGKPKASRAVGSACGANPIPIFIPCHRVLAANKKLGGFSGGLDWKRRLLQIEQIAA
jgi:O-6-methylguanine DNA methyltransferase